MSLHGGAHMSAVDPVTQPDPGSGVALRTLVLGKLPLLVAAVADEGDGTRLRDLLSQRGLAPLPAFLGAELPRGAQVGFMLGADEVRLVDDRDETLLRAVRDGIDTDWLEASRRLKGTMTVLVQGAAPAPDLPAPQLAQALHEAAIDGRVWGAIVGVADERPSLPLMF